MLLRSNAAKASRRMSGGGQSALPAPHVTREEQVSGTLDHVSECRNTSPIPARAGIGLRSPHYREVLERRPDVAFLEVHPENYFGGGKHLEVLEEAARHYPLSLHAVGLSLGAAGPLERNHLTQLKALVDRFNPALVSDHISWSASGNAHLNDLLPLPYTAETLTYIAEHISEVQDTLGRQILVENPSTYLAFSHSTMSEPEFLAAVVEKTGCKLLLDVNNIFVQCHNNQTSAQEYLAVVRPEVVGEIHLAGHTEETFDEETLLIDTHNRPVKEAVWALYERTLAVTGAVPTLIEWDKDIPALDVLLGEAAKADVLLLAAGEEEQRYATG